MGKDMIITTAGIQAVLNVSWRNSKNIVNEYIRASAGFTITEPTRSWCGDFAYWVLKECGIRPMVGLAKPVSGGWDTVSRFGDLYPTFRPGEDTPQVGDMYYMQYVTQAAKTAGGNGTNHVGFVVKFTPGESTFKSVDGNSGTDVSILVKGIGGGYVCFNNARELSLVNYFIRVPS